MFSMFPAAFRAQFSKAVKVECVSFNLSNICSRSFSLSSDSSQYSKKDFCHPAINSSPVSSRSFSTSQIRPQDGQNKNSPQPFFPALSEFGQIRFPHLRHSIRNFFFTHFLIRPYFDPNFSKGNFLDGAKSAVEYVSHCLAAGDLQALEDSKAVTPECLKDLRLNLSTFSTAQREALAVKKEDIVYNFIYQIGIMLEDDSDQNQEPESGKQVRHVEVTYAAHVIPNSEIVLQGNPSEIRRELLERGGPMIINYRFIREYTKGIEDSWTINIINHFYMQQLP